MRNTVGISLAVIMFSAAAWSAVPPQAAQMPGQPGSQPAAGTPGTGLASPLKKSAGCVTTGNGYLRAKIRGALQLDVDYHDSELECDGGARPDGRGFRV